MPLDNSPAPADQVLAPRASVSHATRTPLPPPGFKMTSDGIERVAEDGSTSWLCSPIKVISTFRDASEKGWGRVVKLVSPNGNIHRIPLSDADITSKWNSVLRRLVDAGLRLDVDPKSSKTLQNMIRLWQPDRQQVSASAVGWVGVDHKAFVLGSGKVLGEHDVLPVNLVASSSSAAQIDRGDLGAWRDEVGTLCAGNDMLILAVSTALSGPMLDFLDLDLGGGFHLQGASSQGKSTALRVAASVFGSPQTICSWRATSNGLEALAASVNDTFLPLDELGEIDGRHLGDILYGLANGVGKSRMSNGQGPGNTKRWKVSLLSTGEISIAEKLAEAGGKQMPGQKVRILDITADDQRFGAFDELHGEPNAAVFADRLKHATSQQHGTAGVAFLEGLIRRSDQREHIRTLVLRMAKRFADGLSQKASPIARRAAERFALIAVSGELATQWNITGWSRGDATRAAKHAFNRWHEALTEKSAEAVAPILLTINDFRSRRASEIHTFGKPHGSGPDPVAWEDDRLLYFPTDAWQAMFPGASGRTAAIALKDGGVLLAGEGENLMRKASDGCGGRRRFYTLQKDGLNFGSAE